MHNLIAGYYNKRMKIEHFECLVGGLPKNRKWPFAYKAPFSPVDVIEEYTRPARYREGGKLVIREALSDCEYREFEKLGTLEAFNSDGLRTLLDTLPDIPNMKEKTLRYPGHVEYIRVLKESGFFDTTPIKLNDRSVTPLEFTSKILFNEWKLEDDEEEVTVMCITIRGENKKGQQEEILYELYDEYNPKTKTSSMARTTGYTATAAANMLLDGLFSEKGVFPPELIGKHERCFNYILKYLEDRDINYLKSSRLL
jgi:saccharopine dehydrogenase-like NADP-dependent oxidoreductase